ncbi:hypothetical protein D3C74_362280 [compost metagenome]
MTSPSVSTISPVRAPRRDFRNPWVSPSDTKQMSYESGLFETDSPRRSASSRTSSLDAKPPSGKIERASRSGPMTASTYDWSLASLGERCSSWTVRVTGSPSGPGSVTSRVRTCA